MTPLSGHHGSASGGGVILVRNDSGADQPRFAVLGIDAPIILPEDHEDEFKRQVALSCITPTREHTSGGVILQEPLSSGGIGRACVSGVTVCRVKAPGDAPSSSIRQAGIDDGQSGHLISSGSGVPVIWIADGSGGSADEDRWAIVRLGGGGDSLFTAKLGASSSGAHAWMEVQRDGSSFVTRTGGRSGTTSVDPAYEINGRTAVPADTLVRMMPVTDRDGNTAYLFDLGMGTAGTPANLAYTGEHAEAASSTAWDINSQASSRGVSLTVQTGTRYDHAAAVPTLYAYQRDLTFDANGHLIAISAETRVTIDTPESCP